MHSDTTTSRLLHEMSRIVEAASCFEFSARTAAAMPGASQSVIDDVHSARFKAMQLVLRDAHRLLRDVTPSASVTLKVLRARVWCAAHTTARLLEQPGPLAQQDALDLIALAERQLRDARALSLRSQLEAHR